MRRRNHSPEMLGATVLVSREAEAGSSPARMSTIGDTSMSLSRARKLCMLEATVSEKLRLPGCWLPDLIHSQMATGNMARMAKDAMAKAHADKRPDDVRLYRNMLDQISDYWAELDQ